ncbi:hypothetical protein C9374_004364 [Naegleria lovaniensis]|uniref:Uncharacterized protein n=1 Tax=Naegleria lovaniensis TaxID=51637 RepID=A0AA88GSK8_NAELO|nr:uncharacterized protein C9374_004364 [Naegleria lovaniensis]KAG2383693.1 hypothetical protein C9374_004364 [Naegleria lovaniensis]
MTPAVQCILQYMVYLCNEYQNGRILSIPKAEAEYHEEVLLLLLSYGWNCWTQKDELFYVMCSYLTEKKQHTVLKYLLSKFCSFTKESDLEMFVYSWMVHCCIQNRKIALDCILSHFLHHHEEMLLNVLIKPVLCCKHRDQIFNESGNHIPLVGLLFSRCHSFGGFLLQTIFESMSEKQFKQLVVKETKETILHIFLMTVEQTKAESLDVSLLFTLIRKNPKWLHAKNILNDTPLTLMQRVIQDSYLRFRIEKEFGRKRTNNGSNPKEGNRRKIERE